MYLETLPVGILQGIVLAWFLAFFSACLGNSVAWLAACLACFFGMFRKQCGMACGMFGMFFRHV